MARGMTSLLATMSMSALLLGSERAKAEIPLAAYDGWRVSLDARVSTFASYGVGKGVPEGQTENTGAGTSDTQDASGGLHSFRLRNGFMMSVLGLNTEKQISPNLKVSTRIALWMNITGSRDKNFAGMVDPRELWAKLEGPWGQVLGGSDLALFGRGGILLDAAIAHDYGLGYPCSIRVAAGGGCGMAVFGATFPGYEPGVVYATPSLGGFQASFGAYDPVTIGLAQLDRTPLPRLEGELKYEYKTNLRVFGSGFWQVLEGTTPDTRPEAMGRQKNLQAHSFGVQAGAMVAAGPVQLGGAVMQGRGFGPITYLEGSPVATDPTGVLRDSRGAFGLASVSINSLHLKFAGGAGVWHVDRAKNDSGPQSVTGAPANPRLIKQNFGVTVGAYHAVGPVHLALEYFRAQHNWHDQGMPSAADPNMTASVVSPQQVVHFINAGFTVVW